MHDYQPEPSSPCPGLQPSPLLLGHLLAAVVLTDPLLTPPAGAGRAACTPGWSAPPPSCQAGQAVAGRAAAHQRWTPSRGEHHKMLAGCLQRHAETARLAHWLAELPAVQHTPPAFMLLVRSTHCSCMRVDLSSASDGCRVESGLQHTTSLFLFQRVCWSNLWLVNACVLCRLLSMRRSMSCRNGSAEVESAEGPIRALLVRDDRAWVAGGRTEPWLALFDAVAGAQPVWCVVWVCVRHTGRLDMQHRQTVHGSAGGL